MIYRVLLTAKFKRDWLLIYKQEADKLILTLTRTGSHSDLF